ncbi:TSUP family transporter [Agarivorans sp. MS3-6]|uniref:sulfite exporter TauE/SafE family protein n=1 Tax=Agarivorans sp. TSD2052 TaxID=2937286 RepID=UPI00200D632B|nr:sulfite exporter TauE/SafE family protein [Agarivorans sp. TSD2052]UPW19853.1 sulfite exporter TauE/SafE family protein [Agarivorans sp. TSD2052]
MDSTIIILHLVALLTGVSKFSIGGMGALILPLLLIAYPGGQALAILIPLFLFTDLLTMAVYRHQISWRILARLLLFMVVGSGFGALLLSYLDTSRFTLAIGSIIIGMLVLSIYLERSNSQCMKAPAVAAGSGVFAGFISMTANSAGPIISLYMMQQQLGKTSYISTRAWVAGLVNVAKVPLLMSIGLLNFETAKTSLSALPSLLLGCALGFLILKKVNLKQMTWAIRVLIFAAAIKLLVS